MGELRVTRRPPPGQRRDAHAIGARLRRGFNPVINPAAQSGARRPPPHPKPANKNPAFAGFS
jgi:hypothetical protein